jgi:hypothetical protein
MPVIFGERTVVETAPSWYCRAVKRCLLALVLLIVAGAGALAVAACGGSSSETPFPLEPDLGRMGDGGPPSNAHYVVFTGGRRDAGKESGKSEEDLDEQERE